MCHCTFFPLLMVKLFACEGAMRDDDDLRQGECKVEVEGESGGADLAGDKRTHCGGDGDGCGNGDKDDEKRW